MALDQSALLEVLDALRTADAGERITQAAETIYQALIDAELTAFIGASPHERTETRSNQRNGSRPRTLSTVAGDLELRIPKLRTGSFFPALLERRRRVDQCLFAVVMEAYLHGTSTRKVDDLVNFRRRIRGKFGVRMRSEIKANYLLRNSGDLRAYGLGQGARQLIYRAHMRVLASLGIR
uniref:transposase n=1 Tax=Mycobacterium avium TaxID=1764 RepID=UPI000AAC5BEB